MTNWNDPDDYSPDYSSGTLRLLERLKTCPLCESISPVDAATCFVCGWEGAFERNPGPIVASLDRLAARCPELIGAMLMEEANPRLDLRRSIARTAARLFTMGIRPPRRTH